MFDSSNLFKERFKNHLALLNRYLRYIFNGHFMIALLFIIVTMAVFYQAWLETLSPSFPAAMIVSLLFTIVIMYNPLQLFLQEPDKVFLIVKENYMKKYFTYSLVYNYVIQLYIVIFVIAGLTPLINTAFPAMETIHYILLYSWVFIAKAAMMLTHFWQLNSESYKNYSLLIIQFIIISTLIYSFLHSRYIVSFILLLLFVSQLILVKRQYDKEYGYYWERLINNDLDRLASFYQFASMFAEVPETNEKLRKRKWLAGIVEKAIPFRHDATYSYLYALTFIRSKEYLNMFIRLIILGSIFIIFINQEMIQVLLGIVFIYITAFQMIPLFKHYRTFMWLDIYPATKAMQEKAFFKLSYILTSIQIIIFFIVFLFVASILYSLIFLAAGFVFMIGFHQFYVKQKITS